MIQFNKFFAVTAAALLCLPHVSLAQASASNEPVRPSADAWTAVQYGAVTPSLYTGTLHLSVPLYTYSDPDFEIPISAEYATNGCLPNDKAGSLGVGWTLSVGGSITREVRGIPDDKSTSRHISASHVGNVHGFYDLYNSSLTRSDMTGMPTSGLGFSGRSCVYYKLYVDEDHNYTYPFYDAEPDVFHFNFMGYTGTFQLDFGGVIHVYDTNVPPSSLKIEVSFSTTYGDHSPISITTGDGYRYEFDGYYGHVNDNTEVTYDAGYGTILTWKLSRIIAPNKRTVEFGYTRGAEVRTLRPNTLCYNLGILAPGYTDTQQYANEKGYSDNSVTTADLTSITIDGGTLISLAYDNISEKSYLTSNENANQSLTAFGNDLLRSLIVSYGGDNIRTCSFAFDNNNPGQRKFLTTITVSGEGAYSMQYQNTTAIPMYNTYKVDHWGYFNGQTGANFLDVSTLSNNYMDETLNPSSARTPNATYAKYGTLSRITYPTGGYSTFTYEAHTYGKVMRRPFSYDFWPLAATENGLAGGVRIKRIQHYDSNGSSLDWREYKYTVNSVSTGILIWVPRYKIHYSATNPIGVEEFGTMMSNNLSHYGSTHIEYAAVTEQRPDGSAVRHHYTTSLDYEDLLLYENGAPEKYFYIESSGVPNLYDWNDATLDISKVFMLSSRQFLRGREKAVEMLDESGAVVATTATTFTDVLPNVDWIYTPQYLLHYTYDLGTYVGREDVDSRTESQSYGNQAVSSTTSYSYNSFAQRSSQSVTGSRGEQQITRWSYVSDYATAPTTNMYRKMYDAGQLTRPVSESVYVKAAGSSTETLLYSRTYTYLQPNASLYPNQFCIGSVIEHDASTDTDYTTTYVYNNKGRIIQKTDPAGISTVYIWGYGGLYPVAEVVGARLIDVISNVSGLAGIVSFSLPGALSDSQVGALQGLGDTTVWEYASLVGLTKETTPDGRSTTYTYNASGKLHQVLDDLGRKTEAYLYSPDNKQQ